MQMTLPTTKIDCHQALAMLRQKRKELTRQLKFSKITLHMLFRIECQSR